MLIRNARLATPQGIYEVDILVEQGKISKIGKDIQTVGNQTVDASEYLVIPAAIDGHTHFHSRFLGAKEPIPTADDYSSGSEVALAGGITTYVNFIETSNMKEEIDLAKSTSKADFSFHLIVKNQKDIETIDEAFKLGVRSVKVFMAYRGSMMLSDDEIISAAEKVKKLNGVLAVHAENGDIIEYLRSKYGDKKEAIYHAITRPIETEEEAVNRFSAITYFTGVKSYVVHVSSPNSLDIIDNWRVKGNNIWAETCPHYLVFDTSFYERKDGYRFIMSPPLRDKEYVLSLLKKLEKVYTIGSDYSGYLSKYKDEVESYAEVPNGVASTEFLVPTVYTLALRGYTTIEHAVEMTSVNPAKLYGMVDKGFGIGKDADLVFLKKEKYRVKDWHGKMDHSIYEGVEFDVKVYKTYLRGELVYEDGEIKGGKGLQVNRIHDDGKVF